MKAVLIVFDDREAELLINFIPRILAHYTQTVDLPGPVPTSPRDLVAFACDALRGKLPPT